MKTTFSFLIMIALVASVCAQGDAPNALDSEGKKHGVWEVEFPNSGNVRYRGEFVHGEPAGTFFYYLETGEKSSQVEYLGEGKANATFFHKNGVKMGEGMYMNQAKTGEWRFYDNQSILSSVEQYEAGKLEGLVKVYHLNGNIAAEVPYEAGRKNGPFKEYTSSGKVLREGRCQDDTYDGPFKQYYDDGSLYIEGTYRAAVKDSLWIEYDEDGRIIAQQLYDDGELIKEQLEPGYEKGEFKKDLDEDDIIPEKELERQFYERGGAPR